jgi:hypothetical protein
MPRSRPTFASLTKPTPSSFLPPGPPSDPIVTLYHKCTTCRLRPPDGPSDTSPPKVPTHPAPVPHVFHPREGDHHKDSDVKDEKYKAGHPNKVHVARRDATVRF